MTALPDVTNVVKVALSGTIDGEPWAGITHWRFATSSGPLSPSNCNAIASHFTNRWGAYMASVISDTVSLLAVNVTDLTSHTSSVGEDLTGSVGSVGGNLVSPSVAVLEHKTISRRYRGGHPRTYWPGVTSAQTVSSAGRTLTPAQVTSSDAVIGDYYAGIVADVIADSATNCTAFQEVCVHYKSGGVLLPVPTVDFVAARGIEANLANQRRRMRRST